MALCTNICGEGSLPVINVVAFAASDKAGASSVIEQLMRLYDPSVTDDGGSSSTPLRALPPLPTVRCFEEYSFLASTAHKVRPGGNPPPHAPSKHRKASTPSMRLNIAEVGRPLRGELLSSAASSCRPQQLSDGVESQASGGKFGGTTTYATTAEYGGETIFHERRKMIKKLHKCDVVMFVVDASEIASVRNTSLVATQTVVTSSDDSSSQRQRASPCSSKDEEVGCLVGGSDLVDPPVTHNMDELSCGQVQSFLALRRCLAEMVEGNGVPLPMASAYNADFGLYGATGASTSSSIWSRRRIKVVKRKRHPLMYIVANKQDKPSALSAESIAVQLGLTSPHNSKFSQQLVATVAARETVVASASQKFEWICQPCIAAAGVSAEEDVRFGCTSFVERFLEFQRSLANAGNVAVPKQKSLSVPRPVDTHGREDGFSLQKANSAARLLPEKAHGSSLTPRSSTGAHTRYQGRREQSNEVLPSPLAAVGPYLLAGEDGLEVSNDSLTAPRPLVYSPPADAEGRLLESRDQKR